MATGAIGSGTIRRLWPSDTEMLRAHLLRLDSDSRHDRFGMAVNDSFLENYASRCFGLNDVIYGYLVDGAVRGAGELRGVDIGLPFARGGPAEAAFSVEPEWRQHGIGAELMARIVRAARNRRADTLYMTCLTSNRAMLSLARKFTSQLRHEPDAAEAKISPLPPDARSIFGEATDDAAAFATAMVDLQRRAFAMQPL